MTRTVTSAKYDIQQILQPQTVSIDYKSLLEQSVPERTARTMTMQQLFNKAFIIQEEWLQAGVHSEVEPIVAEEGDYTLAVRVLPNKEDVAKVKKEVGL